MMSRRACAVVRVSCIIYSTFCFLFTLDLMFVLSSVVRQSSIVGGDKALKTDPSREGGL